jgi:hypothetical protein
VRSDSHKREREAKEREKSLGKMERKKSPIKGDLSKVFFYS